MKIISWNINARPDLWSDVLDLPADVALLQEAPEPPDSLSNSVEIDPSPWFTLRASRPWKAAIVKLSDRVKVEWLEAKPLPEAGYQEFAVSLPGTLAVARVTDVDGKNLILASMYGAWESKHPTVRKTRWDYAEASAHRIISDLQMLAGGPSAKPIVAAGDLNILYGYGEHGDLQNAKLYATVFDRMAAAGLPFVGPQYPNGRQATPWPQELPTDSLNVPTYHHNRQNPSSATRQLDFVFASESLKDSISVRALNQVEEWGPSDHCRIEITV